MSRTLNEVLDAAGREAERLKDEYVSVEHVLLAIIDSGSRTAAGRLLGEDHVTRERVLAAPSAVRGRERVSSTNPESSYAALEKYGPHPCHGYVPVRPAPARATSCGRGVCVSPTER